MGFTGIPSSSGWVERCCLTPADHPVCAGASVIGLIIMETETIHMEDGTELEVAEDPETAELVAVAATVSVDETVSTGEYESYEPYASTRFLIRPAIRMEGEPHGRALRQALLNGHRQIHAEVQQMIDNRLSEPGFEEWEATELGDFSG